MLYARERSRRSRRPSNPAEAALAAATEAAAAVAGAVAGAVTGAPVAVAVVLCGHVYIILPLRIVQRRLVRRVHVKQHCFPRRRPRRWRRGAQEPRGGVLHSQQRFPVTG